MPKGKGSIVEVKKRHELQLLKIEGVEGVGITEESGEEYITIYVSISVHEVKKKIPEKLDGYPVTIQKTGPFNAF
jgi:hypothetical protein